LVEGWRVLSCVVAVRRAPSKTVGATTRVHDDRSTCSRSPIPAFTLTRSACSRWADLGVHDGPKPAVLDKRRRDQFGKNPLVYTDVIAPNDEPIKRRWEAWPGRFGIGGPSAAEVFYELVQLYVEQGARGDHIQFKTLNALYRRLHPNTPNPDRKDYDRLRRDLDILCGYRFTCENAFFDRERKAYVHMREWALFTGWTGYTRTPARAGEPYPFQEELPFGAVGVSPVLRTIARNRGLFCIGFDSALFRTLKPMPVA
jgi:hypothetical protein